MEEQPQEVDDDGFYLGEVPWHGSAAAAGFLAATAKKDATRDRKWAKMVSDTTGLERMTRTARSRALLKRRVRKGVPRAWRRAAWPMLLAVDYGTARRANAGPGRFREEAARRNITYAQLARDSAGPRPPDSVEDVIERDLARTSLRPSLFSPLPRSDRWCSGSIPVRPECSSRFEISGRLGPDIALRVARLRVPSRRRRSTPAKGTRGTRCSRRRRSTAAGRTRTTRTRA